MLLISRVEISTTGGDPPIAPSSDSPLTYGEVLLHLTTGCPYVTENRFSESIQQISERYWQNKYLPCNMMYNSNSYNKKISYYQLKHKSWGSHKNLRPYVVLCNMKNGQGFDYNLTVRKLSGKNTRNALFLRDSASSVLGLGFSTFILLYGSSPNKMRSWTKQKCGSGEE